MLLQVLSKPLLLDNYAKDVPYRDYAFAGNYCGGQLRKRSCNCLGLSVLGGAAW